MLLFHYAISLTSDRAHNCKHTSDFAQGVHNPLSVGRSEEKTVERLGFVALFEAEGAAGHLGHGSHAKPCGQASERHHTSDPRGRHLPLFGRLVELKQLQINLLSTHNKYCTISSLEQGFKKRCL